MRKRSFVFSFILFGMMFAGCSLTEKGSILKSAAKKAIDNPERIIDAAINCKEQIQSVEWYVVDYDKVNFDAAIIVPSQCGRVGLHQEAAWEEFVKKVPSHPLWNNDKDSEVYKSMQNQFYCHWRNPEAQLKRPSYKIEPRRKALSLLETYFHGCNYESKEK
ncbi:MAG: DUF2599 domain-containing protein [Patescibacteria group bacterium]